MLGPRTIRRARRHGWVVRSGDFAVVASFGVLLGWWHLWGASALEALTAGLSAGLGASAEPDVAAPLLADAGVNLLLAIAPLAALLVLVSVLSMLAQSAFGGFVGLSAGSRGSWLAHVAAPGASIEALWLGAKAVMLALVLGGLVLDVLPVLGGLLEAAPLDLGAFLARVVPLWLGRVALVGVPILVLDVIVQRFRFRLAVTPSPAGERDEQRSEEGDPYMRALLLRRARRGASTDGVTDPPALGAYGAGVGTAPADDGGWEGS